EVRDGVLQLRRPLSALADLEIEPGTVALVLTIIGVTTFDGASNGVVCTTIGPHVQSVFAGLGLGPTPADELSDTIGLLIALAVVSAFFALGVRGMQSV